VTRFVAAVALVLCGAAANAQVRVVVTDVGPGSSGRILNDALRRPHRLAEPESGQLVIRREVQVRGALIVLGRDAVIEGSVDGDVIVVGGDFFARPGSHIGGRAISIGGGTYPSALAVVNGGVMNFRDNTFDITRVADGYRLAYRSTEPPAEPPLLLPEVYGFRLPSYDRVNGLSVRFGPALAFAGGRGRVDVLATYRSHLGAVDPSTRASLQLSRRTRATLDAGRGSFSNDDWIYLDWVNSFSMLAFGDDTRNFHRADHARLTLFRLWERGEVRWEPFFGMSTERDWSVGTSSAPVGAPWSFTGQNDTTSARRPNPAILPGHLTSAIVGTSMHWEAQDVRLDARTTLEHSLSAPTSKVPFLLDQVDPQFQQLTTDVTVTFPTFGEQAYAMDVHWVTTFGEPALQRFVYLGGSGTLPFLDMLSLGGDELLLIDQRYSIPLTRVHLGDFGNPSIQLRHRIGAAGLGSLPAFETMLGLGVAVVFVRGEVQLDPATGKVRVAAGFTFSR
jgi:hypothetical protein